MTDSHRFGCSSCRRRRSISTHFYMKLHYFRLRTERVIDLNTLTVDTIVHHRQTYTVFVFRTTRLFSLFSYHEFIKSPPIHRKNVFVQFDIHIINRIALQSEPSRAEMQQKKVSDKLRMLFSHTRKYLLPVHSSRTDQAFEKHLRLHSDEQKCIFF